MTITQYLITNIYMGAGIAADVYAATIGSFREFKDDAYLAKWVRRNTLTHTLFPLLGMYAVILGIAAWSPLEGLLFTFGAVLLGTFLWKLVREKAGLNETREPLDATANKKNKLNFFSSPYNRLVRYMEEIDPQWTLVLAVSIDAINSGFAKAADTQGWSLPALLFSFPLVGLVVGTGAWLGGQKAKWFINFVNNELQAVGIDRLARQLTQLEYAALLVELLVLGYFFWRSVASAIVSVGFIEWANNRMLAWGMSGATLFIVLVLFGSKIALYINKESEKSFTNRSLESVTEHQFNRSRFL